MFCTNCGNRLDENACVCVNCGVLVRKRSQKKVVRSKRRGSSNTFGIVSMIFGIISILFSLMLFFHDISSVGMYTEVYERVMYALNYSISSIMLCVVSFIFYLVGKRNTYNSIGLVLSIISFFFIITEFIVVIIY